MKKALKKRKTRKYLRKKIGEEGLKALDGMTTPEIIEGYKKLSDMGRGLTFEKLDSFKKDDIRAIHFKEDLSKLHPVTLKRVRELITDENLIFRKSSIESMYKTGLISKEQKEKMLNRSERYGSIVNK